MKKVQLFGAMAAGRVALVDDEDYDLVAPYRWLVYEIPSGGRRLSGPYARSYQIVVNGKKAARFMHNLITGWPLVDHEDHDGLNNQRSNLRPATSQQNQANRRPTLGSSSIYKGVHWNRERRKWRACIEVGDTRRHLGSFADEQEAALAYNAAALEAFGEFACLNEIPELRAGAA